MQNLEWFDALAIRLRGQGLPAGYINRLCGELRDHYEEASQSGGVACDPETLLGRCDQFSRLVIYEYRRRSWGGRWPMIAFVFAPVLSVYLLCALQTVIGDLVLEGLTWMTGSTMTFWVFGAMAAFCGSLGVIPPAIVVCWTDWIYQASGRTSRWLWLALVLISVCSWTIVGDFGWQDPRMSPQVYVEGTWNPSWSQSLQSLVPWLMGLLLAFRVCRHRGSDGVYPLRIE
jgi:hypothetical protein